MRKIRINDLMRFVKQNSIMHQTHSNNAIRTFIWRGLKHNNLFLLYKEGALVGLIEWFRYKTTEDLAQAFRSHSVKETAGPVLYISNYMFKPGTFNREALRKFFKFHQSIGSVEHTYIMKQKHKEFYIKELRS